MLNARGTEGSWSGCRNRLRDRQSFIVVREDRQKHRAAVTQAETWSWASAPLNAGGSEQGLGGSLPPKIYRLVLQIEQEFKRCLLNPELTKQLLSVSSEGVSPHYPDSPLGGNQELTSNHRELRAGGLSPNWLL